MNYQLYRNQMLYSHKVVKAVLDDLPKQDLPTEETTPFSPPTSQEEPEPSSPTIEYEAIAPRIFNVQGGVVFIGGRPVTPEIRSLLRDEAKYLQQTQLWEVLSASLVNEAIDMALFQSSEWDHVLAAKQLHHYTHFVRNVIHTLSK